MTSKLVVVSGDSGIGKTSVCTQVAGAGQGAGAGCGRDPCRHARRVARQRMGIDVEDLGLVKNALAKARAEPGDGETNGPATAGWRLTGRSGNGAQPSAHGNAM